MREARIIFPTEPLTRERYRFEHDLISAFGGFTRSSGYGAWAGDDGGVVAEEVWVYDVAMPDEDGRLVELFDLAIRYGRQLGQEAVYVRAPSGLVHITSTKTESEPVASPAPAQAPYDPADRLNQAEAAFLNRLTDPEGVVKVRGVDRPLAEFDRPLGTKRLPQAGEVWSTGSGGKAAVTGRASIADGGFYVSLLDPGNYAGVSAGYGFTVNQDGKHLRGGDAHPLDLKSFLTAF